MDFFEEIAAFIHESENLGLEIYLYEPHEKWKIVADIITMPKCTHHENIKGA